MCYKAGNNLFKQITMVKVYFADCKIMIDRSRTLTMGAAIPLGLVLRPTLWNVLFQRTPFW